MDSTEVPRLPSKILIVDDQQDILELMKDILEPEGYQVITLMQVEDIFVEIENNQPDIILLDFLLSGINGGEFCAQIKKNPKTQHIPVIFLSAHSRVIESLGHYGYDDFIAKPFDIKDVLATIKRHLNNQLKDY
jgi:DNA-binding response OmpR family regulator